MLLFLVITQSVSAQVITTIAGNGTAGYTGDGGPATSAELHNPYGVAVDSSGDVYIADASSERIRNVSVAGIITTIAGNGSYGFNGDNIPATAADLRYPYGVATRRGNIYIADFNNNRIRRVSASGIISTIAGNGTAGFNGDGGPATAAELHGPTGVAVDGSGNIYIVEFYNYRIRKVNTSGIISTIAGNGTNGYGGDGGPATSAELHNPFGVAVGGGNVYIADEVNNRIRKVCASGIISTIAGNGIYGYSGDGGPATSSKLSNPTGVAVDGSGNVYIADYNSQRIRKVNTSGIICTIAGNGTGGFSGDHGPATSAELHSPQGVAVGGDGSVYIADYGNQRVRKVSAPHNNGIPTLSEWGIIIFTLLMLAVGIVFVRGRQNTVGNASIGR